MAKKVINVVYKVDSRELEATKKSIHGSAEQAKKFDESLKKVGTTAKTVGKDAGKSFLDFKNILATVSFVGILSGLTSLGRKIFDLGVQQEQLNIAFTTFLGSAEKAKKLLAELTKFAIVTPFTPEQVNKAARTLLAFGTAAKDIIPTLKMIGDVSAGTGKDLAEMAVIFGQIKSTGRLMGQDLLQLINAGFNPLQVISEKTGKSVKVLKEEMEKGLISFDMISDAFKTATSEGGLFFNLMEKQSVSVGGKLSTISGNLDEAMKSIFQSNTGIIKSFVDVLTDASEGLMMFFETVEQKQQKQDQSIIERFEASKFTIQQELEILEKKRKEIRQSIDVFGPGSDFTEEDFKAIEHEIEVITRLGEAKLKDAKADAIRGNKKKLNLSANERPIQEMDVNLPAYEDEWQSVLDAADKFGDDLMKVYMDDYDKQTEITKTQNDEEIKAETDKQEKLKAIKQGAFDFGLGLVGMLLTASLQSNREEMAAIDEKYSREIELAGNNEAAKRSIEKKREIERKEAMKRQAKDEREQRIKTILAESLVNAVKALGLPPIPGANFIEAAKALAYGVIQAGLVGKYKEGGWINGPGTPTSDSVPIMASRNEFMVNAAAAAQSPNLLEAINERKINDSILRSVAATGGRQVNMLDDSRIVRAIKENQVDYISHGYTLMKVEKAGANFKRYIRSKIQGY